MPASIRRTVGLTLLTLVAFAGNSILCRLALQSESIDAASFTALRILSGALVLLPLWWRAPPNRRPWSLRSSLALVIYAIAFSFAYVSLDTGTGALLLFGCVQLTMIGHGWRIGERLSSRQLLGMIAAVAGVVVLVAPGVTAPDPLGTLLMSIAGLCWGVYSLRGRGGQSPSLATACNFALAAPVILGAWLLLPFTVSVSTEGLLYAVASGAATSGFGYIVWYAALAGHTATSAAIVQLAVPILAALGGIVLIGEAVTMRLLVASALTLGGIAFAVLARKRPT